MTEVNKQIQLAKRPKGLPTMEDFRFVEGSIPRACEGEVVIRTLYLSVDPYMRGRMNDEKSYIAPFQLDEVITGGVIGEVVESRSTQFKQGDVVSGMLGWQQFSVAHENELRKLSPELAPVTTALGILGMPGLTAYFGLLEIGKPQEGETVVVSGAAGAVGSIVGQIAKIKGARVVGIAGSDEKISYLLDELGFDAAINYKTETSVKRALQHSCPDGVDVYFDNVGGEVSDAVMPLLNRFARIPLCGAISSYNAAGKDIGPRIQPYLVKNSVLMQGFIVANYQDRFTEGIKELATWLREGKLTYEETITEGFENIPDAFLGLFEGKNLGKQLVKVAEAKYAIL
ncbi:NADP-dependent oxidoreductase [Desertibacillus haloalkaliphilus]|uniref:NADP-dependent oxidoreductase n=1 Tax=Desertibacillus haloalkaliphilus TaxID=1328930 RepID=UPI001C27D841|nr:NADP-dependent oxidoreductase [Desertibacillus haloalkaliphilus]MBU8908015.1 NADP-dependent oxidoreductase [Desertibacillus haloalkaliphilus]